MPSPVLAADILAGVLAVAIPLTGPLERRIYRSDPATRTKLLVYGVNVLGLWLLAAFALRIEGWDRLFQSPAEGADWLWMPGVTSLALGAGVVVYAVVGLLPLVQSLRGPRWRRAYAAAYRREMSDIPGFLPDTLIERMAWVVVSLTAGICEEILSRGFLIRFLHESNFQLPLAAALIVSSLIFGVSHLYQGFKSVLGTAVVGLAFGTIFLLTGNLLVSIILHALVDLQVAYILRPFATNARDTAERTLEG